MKIICPENNCQTCTRLVEFRNINKQKYPSYYNGAVHSFGSLSSQILVVGLAPGLNGANQNNRPFTGDYAGDVLYPALKKYGFAKGNYNQRKDDGFELINTRVTNAVRCVPPQNKVTGQEIKNCGIYLENEVKNMPNLKLILSLGAVAHNAIIGILGYKKSEYKFAHNTVHELNKHNIVLINSYHTSRYNINTGVLTPQMFDNIINRIKNVL